ncbi:PREDICTED: uncharacterized protein LOC106821587 [Priapulus caudatus]|uniref:protein xylosyltransferase n=1 Tax=Priapulus caudatus TaxID=37621 RepID=A0ABM1FBY6_PRICU|nr:PREDICTED: uncharacterized protein LOC106821587 [Priapulus caudatus]
MLISIYSIAMVVNIKKTTCVGCILLVVLMPVLIDGFIKHPSQQEIQLSYAYYEKEPVEIIGRSYEILETTPRVYLMCPKDYFISKIHYSLRLSPSFLKKLGKKDESWLYTISDALDIKHIDVTPPCGTIKYCMGFQACLFTFSNEFCKNDPVRGIRKVVDLYLTCENDADLEELFLKHEVPSEVPSQLTGRRHHVMLITHSSFIETGVSKLSDVQVFPHIIPETQVFGVQCADVADVYNLGFRGVCHSKPQPGNLTSNYLWKVLGRVLRSDHRKEITNVYCAFQYNRQGRCFPPEFVNPTSPSSIVEFTRRILPENGVHPQQQMALLQHPHLPLIPTRLGFMLLVHNKAELVMELLDLIYRKQHFYVIHVDTRLESNSTRMELHHLLGDRYGEKGNVRMLPIERSFRTAWASWNYIRAHLECLEELLRMGVWDFVINLSAADLPLRSVDDIAAALAPHRGKSFFYAYNKMNLDRDPLWYGCDFLYNLGRKGASPIGRLTHHSVWFILGRNFAQHIVSAEERQNSRLNEIQLYMMTVRVMDEHYFYNMLAQSPLNSTLRHKMVNFCNANQRETVDKLCRHRLEADFCGMGPAIFENKDVSSLRSISYHTFFARKFPTDSTHSIRKNTISWMKNGLTKRLEKGVTNSVIRQLAVFSAHILSQRSGTSYSLVEITNWKFLPAMEQNDVCCKGFDFERKKMIKLMDYRYWIEFTVIENKGERTVKPARVSVHPKPAAQCYPWGHLRATHITTQPDNAKLVDEFPRLRMLPGEPAGGDTLWLDMLLDVGLSDATCQQKNVDVNESLAYASFPKLKINLKSAGDLQLIASLVAPSGEVKCNSAIMVTLDSTAVGTSNYWWIQHKLSCGILNPGVWTVNIHQAGEESAFVYSHTLLLWEDKESSMITDLWTVEDVVLIQEVTNHESSSQENHRHGDWRDSRQFSEEEGGEKKETLCDDTKDLKSATAHQSYGLTTEPYDDNDCYRTVTLYGGLAGIVGLLLLTTYILIIAHYKGTVEKRKTQNGIYIVSAALVAQILIYFYTCHPEYIDKVIAWGKLNA